MIPILILAAGASSRMRGKDKLLEIVEDVPLLRLQIDRALMLGGMVYVALPDQTGPRHAIVAETAAIPLQVADAAEGIGATLRDAVGRLPPCDAVMVMLADLPEITGDDLQTVVTASETQSGFQIWRGATQDGRAGHPIIFAAPLRPLFAELHGDHGAGAIIKQMTAQTCLVPLAGNRALLDLDTPEDWDTWRSTNG